MISDFLFNSLAPLTTIIIPAVIPVTINIIPRTRLLAPFEKHINEIRFCIAEGSREIEALEEECRNLISEQDYGTDGGISCMM